MEIKYLTLRELLLIHSIVIDETGGAHGVRDTRMLFGVVEAPKQHVFGKELYPTVFEKAGIYVRDIIMNHPFIDGNKRTGMTVAGVFLENNGFTLFFNGGEVEHFALKIVRDHLGVSVISKWLESHSE